jgi:putative ABC transport system permease protein
MIPLRNLPVAWLQLSHGRTKLLAAVVGIVFADLLMWMQLGFLGAAIDSATSLYEKLSGELVVINPLSHEINTVEPFSRRLLSRAGGKTRPPETSDRCSPTASSLMPRL